MLVPDIGRFSRIKNVFLNGYECSQGLEEVSSYPTHVRIAPVSVCNYRCLFCEIHKDNRLYPKRAKNELTIERVREWRTFLSRAYALSFFGGSEEPLLCKDFGEVCRELKRSGTRLMVNTNASLLTPELSDVLVDIGFDEILVSYHAGTDENYKFLMTGNKNRVDANLSYLKELKAKTGAKLPVINFNYALHKLNANDHEKIAISARDLGVSTVIVNKYYGGRNALDCYDVAYDKEPDVGNRVLDEIYTFAKGVSVHLAPAAPDYWRESQLIEGDGLECVCDAPWKSMHFNPVLDAADCHYVGVCNRIELFKIDYSKINIGDDIVFSKIWNSSVLKYLRRTVNAGEATNSICRFCKNPNRAYWRNVDPDKYAAMRDDAVKKFFEEVRAVMGEVASVDGMVVLNCNPNADILLNVDRSDTVSGNDAD